MWLILNPKMNHELSGENSYLDLYYEFSMEQWKNAVTENRKIKKDLKKGNWDKIAFLYDETMEKDRRRVDKMMAVLEAKGVLNKKSRALDIGCGTGIYALELAKRCKEVVALDSSENMLSRLNQKMDDQQVKNISCIHGDWKEWKVSHQNYNKKFDIVISALNTGINNVEALEQMNQASCNCCCYSSLSGISKDAVKSEIEKMIFGKKLKVIGHNEILHAFNIVYAMGYHPEITYVPFEWRKVKKPDEAFQSICEDYPQIIDLQKKEEIKKIIRKNCDENGNFIEKMEATLGIMVWRVKDELADY